MITANKIFASDTTQCLEKIKSELNTLFQINQANCRQVEFIFNAAKDSTEYPDR